MMSHPLARSLRQLTLVGVLSSLLWFPGRALGQGADRGGSASESETIESFAEPYRDVDVAAAEMGVIAVVHVREGQRVRRGDPVAELDDRVLRASVEVARRTMESLGKLESAQAELAYQEGWLAKLRQLRERDHATVQEVERTLSQRNVALARVKTVRDELDVHRLEHDRLLAQWKQRTVRAPLDGVVTRVLRDEGEFVSPSGPGRRQDRPAGSSQGRLSGAGGEGSPLPKWSGGLGANGRRFANCGRQRRVRITNAGRARAERRACACGSPIPASDCPAA